jgi:uncharacterized protein YodC (DUF2158 family)
MLEKQFEKEKIFFLPGDLVTIKQPLPNKPVMLVKGKETKLVRKQDDASHLKGIRCQWFTSNGELQEAVFSTKDLELYKP